MVLHGNRKYPHQNLKSGFREHNACMASEKLYFLESDKLKGQISTILSKYRSKIVLLITVASSTTRIHLEILKAYKFENKVQQNDKGKNSSHFEQKVIIE